MTYTVTKLITNAYYISGVVSRDFQTVQGSQFEDGLQMLNEILTDKTVEDDMVPYFSHYTFPAVQGIDTYFIPNLIQLDTFVFFIGNIRYEMTELQRRRFFGSSRANNIQSLPFTWHLERCFGGANLYLYFVPNTAYPMEAWGQFRLGEVDINQDLSSKLTTVNLGAVSLSGTGTLNPGQFLINGIDMAGAYASAQLLVNHINNISTDVVASLYLNQITLSSNVNITISTSGVGDLANTITFINFNTLDGPKNQTYFPLVLDQFYITYLKYALANRICYEFDYVVPVGVAKQLEKYEGMISKRSQQLDLRMEKISTLGTGTGINYGQVNLGHGWTI